MILVSKGFESPVMTHPLLLEKNSRSAPSPVATRQSHCVKHVCAECFTNSGNTVLTFLELDV